MLDTLMMSTFERLNRQDLEIDEVTIGVSRSMGTPPTTKIIMSVRINLEKYEHPYRVEDSNPSE